ncbi:hypothetical protein WA158_006679 [Blastocystis sp. Blastoise]
MIGSFECYRLLRSSSAASPITLYASGVLQVEQVDTYPNHVEITTSFSATGTVWCIVQNKETPEPQENTVKDHGVEASVTANVEAILVSKSLNSNTEYNIYCYAETNTETPMTNSIASTKKTVQTQDVTNAPFMFIDNIDAASYALTISVLASEPGKAFCLINNMNTPVPSYYTLIHTGKTNTISSTYESTSMYFDNLNSETSYNVYCIFESTSGIYQRGSLDKIMKIGKTAEAPTSVGVLVLQIVLCVLLVCMSGMFSGLNLGLMGLDVNSLKMISESNVNEIVGTDINDNEVKEMMKQKEYAKVVGPVRQQGNLLLVTLLVGNVMVNSLISILSADFTSGVWGFIISTVFITTFGEIVPQAVCSRYGLLFGAKTIWYTKFLIYLLWIICKPISMLLDCVLGEEIGNIYNRWQLYSMFELYKGKNKFGEETISTIQGALSMDTAKISVASTPIDQVYMLAYSQILDQNTCLEIFTKGYSRIPIYKDTRSNIVGILYVKDLILVDPHEKLPISTLLQLFNRPFISLDENTNIATALKEMTNHYVGMCILTKIIEVPGKDNDIVIDGIVTMEDLIEKVLMMDLNDETDAPAMDIITKSNKTIEHFFDTMQIANIDKDLLTIIETFLHNAIRRSGYEVDQMTVEQLIKKGELKRIQASNIPLYTYNEHCDFCTILLEGLVECEIGKDKILSEKSRFTVLGFRALIESNYIKGYVKDALVLIIPKSVADGLSLSTRLTEYTGEVIAAIPRSTTTHFRKGSLTNSVATQTQSIVPTTDVHIDIKPFDVDISNQKN